MAILRGTLPTDSFTIISNAWLRDSALSWKAKGLLAYISSHAAGHSLTSEQIVTEGTDGKDAVRAGLIELEERGYLRRVQQRGEGGKITGTDYVLQEPAGGSSSAGKPAPGSDQGQHDVSAGGDHSGKSSAGQPAGKKTTSQEKTKKTPSASPRGTRLPEDWMPSDATKQWCAKNLPAAAYQRAGIELTKFRNYWTAKTGAGATKLDWERTFQNWMINAAERYGTAPTSGAPAGAAPRSFKQMDADDREREDLIVQAMDIVLSARPSMKAPEAREIVLAGIAAGELDLNALKTSAATGYIDAVVIDPEVKEVAGS